MSVPSEVIQKALAGGGAGGAGAAGMPGAGAAAGGPAGGSAAVKPPSAGPMSSPQEKKGLKAAAMVNVHIAMNMLEEALPALGSENEHGSVILKALTMLAKITGKRDSSDLVPAEVMQMNSRLPQMGGGTEAQKMIRQMISQQGMKPPPQGGAGGGAPQLGNSPMQMGA